MITWLDCWHEIRQLIAEVLVVLASKVAPKTRDGFRLRSAVRGYCECVTEGEE